MQNTGLLLCPRSYVKDCPFQSSNSSDWLAYLDRLERGIRSGRIVDTEDYLIAVYEAAVQAVPENWSDQNYTIMIMRLAILVGNSSGGENADLLISLRICGRTNAPLMIALAHYYALLGQTKRAEDVLEKAKANVTSEDAAQLVEKAMELLKSKISLRPLTGVYDYVPFAKGALHQACTSKTAVLSPGRRARSASPENKKRPEQTASPKTAGRRTLEHERPENLQSESLTCASEVPCLDASNTVPNGNLSGSSVSSMDISCSSMEVSQCQPSNSPSPSMPVSQAPVYPTAALPPSRLPQQPQHPQTSLGRHRAISKIIEIDETEDEESETDCQETLLVQPRQRCRHRSSSSADRTLAMHPHRLSDERLLGHPRASAGLSASASSTAPNCPPPEDKENLRPIRQYQQQRQLLPPSHPPRPPTVRPEKVVGSLISKKDLNVISDLFESSGVCVSGEKYIVLREIGHGGSSTVYCVLNRERKLCALKQVSFAATHGVLDVCQNEVNLLLSLRDTGRVISIFSYELTTTHLALVMELAEQNFKLFLQERAPSAGGEGLSNAFIIFYWTEMLACIKILHDRRIVHLDLKPENFVLVQGRLKLIDLGISQRLPLDCTHMDLERPMGSMAYMSPEQMLCISGSTHSSTGGLTPLNSEYKVRLKADIWALGIILFEMTFGHTPFHGVSPASIIASLLNPNYHVQIPPTQNMSLVKALRRCLVRDTRMRATVDDLLRMSYCACPNSTSFA
uniref:Dual specificity protein kinase TTK n=2 Tax=Schistocephalus solidus TaxID=70667 RepID=A0A0X3P106_SCHSO